MYRHPTRKVGSQSETPHVSESDDGETLHVDGYQTFTVTRNPPCLQLTKDRGGKLRAVLHQLQTIAQTRGKITIADYGCSNGALAFSAKMIPGCQRVLALDHDIACVKALHWVQKWSGIDVDVRRYSFGDDVPVCDVGVALALIHWVYSCTALCGSLDAVVATLRRGVNHTLIVEWVDPKDHAIRKFKHLHFNSHKHKTRYTHVNFMTALKRHFTHVRELHTVTRTRIVYIAFV